MTESEIETKPEPELVKHAAQYYLANAQEMKSHLIVEHAASFRWLLASLLAINGGAAIAVLSSDKLPSGAKIWAGGFFTVGIFAALLLAYFSQKSLKKTLQPIGEIAEHWVGASYSGELDTENLQKADDEIKKALTVGRLTEIPGWISAICFGIGVIQVGRALT